jgi:hypothetical protein
VYCCNYDAQWNSAPAGVNIVNKAYDGSSARSITAKKTWANQVNNEFVCHYGVVTHYGCGYITDKYYTPTYIPNGLNRFIVVHRDGVDLCSQGDSGGPWFFNNTAYGIMSGEHNTTDAIYMAEDFLESALSVFVLTN